jgi:hypothetical protein
MDGMMELWNVELHSHTRWSKDSIVSTETVIDLCRKRGIHKIAITDHNTAQGALDMHKRAPDLVIVGEEIMTTKGELLAYYLQESIPPGLPPEETIRRLRAQGAVISVSHPFDRLRKGAWLEQDLLTIIDQVDAVEVFNARCLFSADNVRAVTFAHQHGVAGTIGSDAHCRAEYGRALTVMQPFHDAPSFLASLRAAQSTQRYSNWFVHINSKTAKWSKKLKLRPRLWDGG